MRQGQQNRRGRGRNRKGQNPLSRSFESNGPDMKIRGTPAHIAEKYISLARDALSSGDPVLAENYLQHAEHYNRIIMTFREQQAQPNVDAANGAGHRNRSPQNGVSDSGESRSDDESEEHVADEHGNESSTAQPQSQNGRANNNERNARGRGDGGGQRERRGRGQGSNRQNGRQNSSRDQGHDSGPNRRGGGNDREGFGSDDAQPEFLKRPVRRRRDSEAPAEDAEPAKDAVAVEESQD